MDWLSKLQPKYPGKEIKSDDINELQEAIQKAFGEIYTQNDTWFELFCLFVLQQQGEVNALFIDRLQDESFFNVAKMKNLGYDKLTKSIGFLNESAYEGTAVTKTIVSPTEKNIRHILLITNEYKPEGTEILYEISHDGENYVSITPNGYTPITLEQPKPCVYLKIKMKRSSTLHSPKLYSWALLYQDDYYAYRYVDDGITTNIESGWDGTIVE